MRSQDRLVRAALDPGDEREPLEQLGDLAEPSTIRPM